MKNKNKQGASTGDVLKREFPSGNSISSESSKKKSKLNNDTPSLTTRATTKTAKFQESEDDDDSGTLSTPPQTPPEQGIKSKTKDSRPHSTAGWAAGFTNVLTRTFTHESVNDIVKFLDELYRTKNSVAINNGSKSVQALKNSKDQAKDKRMIATMPKILMRAQEVEIVKRGRLSTKELLRPLESELQAALMFAENTGSDDEYYES
ncbi:hypothetical protein KCU61_g8185, partial [Aureobasidium melanogenum]